jgi:16S rRNA (cytosine967-C5)-methyltransferase
MNIRQQAIIVLDAILEQHCTFDAAMAAIRMEESARPALAMLVLSYLRHRGQIDALLANVIDKPIPAKRAEIMHALRIGVTDLLLLNTASHAAVNEIVTVVKKGKHAALAGMVNAVLKKIAAEKPKLGAPEQNLPSWLGDRWKPWYGGATLRAICHGAAERPPLDINSPRDFSEGARLDGMIWRMDATHPPVAGLVGYHEGEFFIQDIAASLPVRMLGEVSGMTALDIGAAPGGKTAQLARAGASVTALDKSQPRSVRLHENMKRLKIDAEIIVADALQWQPEEPFDIVLLDAPCTATGTWRRHPEVLITTTPEDIAELEQTQRNLLARAWGWVKPGGRLLYCVCSLEREEGEDQAEWFLSQQADATLQPALSNLPGLSEQGLLRTTAALMADQGGMDGFFAAIFIKQ